MNKEEILQAKQWWDTFQNTLTLDEKQQKQLAKLSEPINNLKLHAYFAEKDYSQFDQAINTLSGQYLYDEDLIPVVYECYTERNMQDKAFQYVIDAINFYEREGLKLLKVNLEEYKRRASNEGLFQKLRETLLHLRNLQPEQIPPILPQILNGNIELRNFILEEILQALKVMRKKIKAVESINSENKYNDILQSILKLRLSLWGWDIIDQERAGSSQNKKEAGEIDLTIKAINDLTIVEAFILIGRNFKKTNEHILKCIDYNRDIPHYYIVVYYKGARTSFDKTWEKYKEDVCKIKFPTNWELKDKEDFTELHTSMRNTENLKIAHTSHGKSSQIFHIMLDLSEPSVIEPIKKLGKTKKSETKTLKRSAKKTQKKNQKILIKKRTNGKIK